MRWLITTWTWGSPDGAAVGGGVHGRRGHRGHTLIDVVTLFPRFEFNVGATLYREDRSTDTTDHFSTTLYLKYMFFENAAKNGGFAVMAGTGVQPGYLQAGTVTEDFKTYWAAFPVTFPFLDGALSWDLLPGASVTLDQGPSRTEAWGFTYSSRLAVYKVIPQSAIVGEIFGTEGDAYSKPQYKVGVRWESKYVVAALTYGGALDGSRGAGIELGVMILSPPFLCIGGC